MRVLSSSPSVENMKVALVLGERARTPSEHWPHVELVTHLTVDAAHMCTLVVTLKGIKMSRK